MSVNKVILVGNVGTDPDVRHFSHGGRVCNIPVATHKSFNDKKTGERREYKQWHRVAIFSEGLVGVAEKFIKKGTKVYLEGELETRKFTDQSGQERYTTEVALRPYQSTLHILGNGKNANANQEQNATASGSNVQNDAAQADQGSNPPSPEIDDDIPF